MQWSELSLPWQVCFEEAWTAFCAGNVPVGAVVVNESRKAVSRGRNRITPESPPGQQVSGSDLAHAELNALLALGERRFHPQIHNYSIYTTVEPCPLCLGAIYMSGVRRIYFAAGDAYAGSTNLLGKTPYLSRKQVWTFGPFPGGLAEFAGALHIAYNLRIQAAPNPVVEVERPVFPRGVRLGEALFASGLLEQWKQQCAGIEPVFDQFQAWQSTIPG